MDTRIISFRCSLLSQILEEQDIWQGHSSPILICYFPAGQLIYRIFLSMPFICSEFCSLYTSACFYECPCPKSKRPVTLLWREFITLLMAAYFSVFTRFIFSILGPRVGWPWRCVLTGTSIYAHREKHSCPYLGLLPRKWRKTSATSK